MKLNLTHALLTNKNERVEKHGEENKLAVDVSFTVTLTDISEFSIGEPDWFSIDSIKLNMEYHEHVVEISDMFHEVLLMNARLCKFKITPDEESWSLSFQVQQTSPADADLTALAHLIQSRVEVKIQPESAVPETDGTANVMADALDGIEGRTG